MGGQQAATTQPRESVHSRILCHVMQRDWGVTFLEADCQTRIGPWLLCDSLAEVDAILRWGQATAGAIEEHHRNLGRWGVGGAWLNLTRMQHASLGARGLGWPWNGYELSEMKRAGRYPPERLTQAQEAAFLRSRKR